MQEINPNQEINPMQPFTQEWLNLYFSGSLAGANFAAGIVEAVRPLWEANRDRIWLTEEYFASSDKLLFAIANGAYIITNFNHIRPTDREDAEFKLYAYVRYNSVLNVEILMLFYQCRRDLGFDYYRAVQIGDGKYNAFQTHLYEHVTMRGTRWIDKVGNDPESIENIKLLMNLVNLSEIDSSGNDSLYYLHGCKKSEILLRNLPTNNQRSLRIINELDQACHPPIPVIRTIRLDATYYNELIILPKWLRQRNYRYISDRFNVKIQPNTYEVLLSRKH